MCVVSNVGDHYTQRWNETWPWPSPVDRAEFDALKREVEEMKRLLQNAKEIDEVTGQAGCEIESKVALLRQIAEAFGVSLDDVLGEAHD